MAMTRFEKLFVNHQKKAERNIDLVRNRLHSIDLQNVRDVLEIGCGIGALSAFFASEFGMNVYGTDFDPEQIQIARELQGENSQLQFRIEDASRLTFEDTRFDLVISQDVFHHIARWPQAVREIARVIRLNGYVIWIDMVFPSRITKLFKPLVKNYGLYTLDELRHKFGECGFVERFHEHLTHGPFNYHYFLFQKA
jgi:ubiquinone/menaquinone biosynthesis C-methylase UbiE